jgi:competence protein ComEA
MERISYQELAVYAAAVIAIGLIGARYLADNRSGAAAQPRTVAPAKLERRTARAVVYVSGAVRRPGVYRLPAWARLDLALERAGGPRPGADLEAVNLAAKVADGQQVVVPRRAGVAGATGAAAADQPVSLNTATVEQLDTLEGVGPATAEKILSWRSQHGGFRSVEDLKQIGGIGPKRFETLKAKVRM